MSKPCGCEIHYTDPLKPEAEIVYCSLHAAAAEMRNVIERLLRLMPEPEGYSTANPAILAAEKILIKANSKPAQARTKATQ